MIDSPVAPPTLPSAGPPRHIIHPLKSGAKHNEGSHWMLEMLLILACGKNALHKHPPTRDIS
jgi:hypothetical protein